MSVLDLWQFPFVRHALLSALLLGPVCAVGTPAEVLQEHVLAGVYGEQPGGKAEAVS